MDPISYLLVDIDHFLVILFSGFWGPVIAKPPALQVRITNSAGPPRGPPRGPPMAH